MSNSNSDTTSGNEKSMNRPSAELLAIVGMGVVILISTWQMNDSLRHEMRDGFAMAEARDDSLRQEIGTVREDVNGLRHDMHEEFAAIRRETNNKFLVVAERLASLETAVSFLRDEVIALRNDAAD